VRAFLQYGWLFVLVIIGVLLYVFFRGRFMPDIGTEMEGIKAESDIRATQAATDRDTALAQVDIKYKAELKALSIKQKEEADELRKDPAKLARYLVRTGAKSRAR
jgi:hypothetical protein